MKTLLLTIFLLNMSAFAASNVAKVIVFKGKVFAVSKDNKKTPIKRGEWLREGTKVQTSAKSFVRLKFIDKSQMNVGPESEVKIEKFSKDKAGVISVLKGKLRSKVSKDYLQMEEGKSKLFVKSKNAVMGIRGTDFSFMVGKNQAVTAVLYEGSVYFNKMEPGNRDLESIVNRGVAIRPGEFSVVNRVLGKPTIPAKMNKRQFNALKKNGDYKRSVADNGKKGKAGKGVPPGLSAGKVANKHSELTKEVTKVTKITDVKVENVNAKKAIGFKQNGSYKPTDGSPVNLETGEIIAPRIDSLYDNNTETYDDQTVQVDENGNVEKIEPKAPKEDGGGTSPSPQVNNDPAPTSPKPQTLGPEIPTDPVPGTDGPGSPLPSDGPAPAPLPNDPLDPPTADAPQPDGPFLDPGPECTGATCGGPTPPSDPTPGNPNTPPPPPPPLGGPGRVIINPTNGNP